MNLSELKNKKYIKKIVNHICIAAIISCIIFTAIACFSNIKKNDVNVRANGLMFDSKIAYESQSGLFWQVCIMDPDGENKTNLSNNSYDEGNISWSPDNKKITFVSNRDGHYQIYIMDPDGKNQVNISKSKNMQSSPAWSK